MQARKIPIWQRVTRSLPHPNNQQQFIIPESLSMIFSDDRYEIFSSISTNQFLYHQQSMSINSIEKDNHNHNHSQSLNQRNYLSNKPIFDANKNYEQKLKQKKDWTKNQMSYEQLPRYSIVSDKKYGRVIEVRGEIHGCLCIDRKYYLFLINQTNRYKTLKTGEIDLIQLLSKLKYGQSDSQNQKLQQDTQLKPLKKIKPQLMVSGENANQIFLIGSQPLYKYQITSPVWKYCIQQSKWSQINFQMKGRVQHQFKALVQNQTKSWIFGIGKAIIFIQNGTIYAKFAQYLNLKTVDKCLNIPSDLKQGFIIDPKLDSYISCSYVNSEKRSCLLLLTKSVNINRHPILLSISYIEGEKQKSMVRAASKKKQAVNQVRSLTQQNNSESLVSQYIYLENKKGENAIIQIRRYDIGVFLNQANPICNSDNYSMLQTTQSQKKIQQNHSHSCLLSILNEICYMQVVDTLIVGIHHSMSSTGGTKKIVDDAPKSSSKKIQTLILYCRIKMKPGETSLNYETYSIKLNLLQRLGLNETNRPLSFYAQLKQYCDLIFLAENKEVTCNRQLFQLYSPKFKKLYSHSANSRPESSSPTFVKLEQTKLSAIYFLVKHMYYQFYLSFDDLDQNMLIDLMVLSQKFQVTQMQVMCQNFIHVSIHNFTRLYDYFRNAETPKFKEQFLKFFIIHSQQIIKIMPIGKVQELIRLIYSPECSHTNFCQIKSKIDQDYIVSQLDQNKQFQKSTNLGGIIQNESINLKICLKCYRLLNFQGLNQGQRNRKSNSRGFSVGSFGHKKKDNNSN